jgi:hypothetical protein
VTGPARGTDPSDTASPDFGAQDPDAHGIGPRDAGPAVPGPRIDLGGESPERGLAALVLTVVELLRQLMERQALRRIDEGDLADEDIERVGAGLMALDERMDLICAHFGLSRSELNLDLGPLGSLLTDR